MYDFRGKVAVVTGAASGIGRAIVERCVQEGMKAVLADIDQDRLARAEANFKACGATVLAVRTDVSQARDVQTLAEKTVDTFGGVHLLCNNAGVAAIGSVWESTLADWEWVIDVNLWSVIHGVRAFVPIMLAQGTECHIVNTASMSGLISAPGAGAYNVAKHGVVTLSETLHHELVERGAKIKVSVLCPGIVNTRIMEPMRTRASRVATDSRDPVIEARLETLRQLVPTGMPPAQVAAAVFEALRQDKFYILTHPEGKDAIKARMEDIVQERDPTPFG